MKNKPPWTFLLNDLSDARKKHWARFDLKKHELFSDLSLDNVKMNGVDLTEEYQIILSTMIMHPNIHQGINMYNDPNVVYDRAFHEDSFIYDNYEDNEIPPIEIKNKELQYQRYLRDRENIEEQIIQVNSLISTLNNQEAKDRDKLIKEVRDILSDSSEFGSLYLGGTAMIASDMMSFVKSDLNYFGACLLYTSPSPRDS